MMRTVVSPTLHAIRSLLAFVPPRSDTKKTLDIQPRLWLVINSKSLKHNKPWRKGAVYRCFDPRHSSNEAL